MCVYNTLCVCVSMYVCVSECVHVRTWCMSVYVHVCMHGMVCVCQSV